MMAWDLGGNWSTELLRMRLALTLPVERINQLMPPYPGEQPLPTADYAALFRGLKIDAKLGQHGAGRRAGIGHRRHRLEQLGRRRLAQRERQAAARERPAPEAQRAGAVVPGTARGARSAGGRRDDAGAAVRRARAERAHRLGLHEHRPRRAGPLPRAHQARRRRAATRRPTAGRSSRRFDETIKVKGGGRREDDGAGDAPRPGDLRRRRRRRPARPGEASRPMRWRCAGPRSTPTRSRSTPASRSAAPARSPTSSPRRPATARRCRTWWSPTATATSAWSRPAACRCASPRTT